MNKIKIEAFISEDMDNKLENFQIKHDMTRSEIIRKSINFWVSYIEDFYDSISEVDNKLNNINNILNKSGQSLQNLAKDLFEIANNTNQSLKVTAETCKKFAEQGLSGAESLKRTKDSLILSRLSGIEINESINAITAAIDSFNNDKLNSTMILNKLTSIDSRFAVSSSDLVEALGRVGQAANDAGIRFDELIGIVSAAKQITQKNGTIIGNSLKSIFLKMSQLETIEQLKKYNLKINQDNIVNNIIVISKKWSVLSKADQNEIVDIICNGIFQAIIFLSIIKDMSNENGIYNKIVLTK